MADSISWMFSAEPVINLSLEIMVRRSTKMICVRVHVILCGRHDKFNIREILRNVDSYLMDP